MTEKSEIDLLYEAAAFCGFNPAEGWRAEMSPRQLAALMAGGGWKSAHKQAYCVCKTMIDNGIKSGKLETRQETPPAKLVRRDADDLSEYQRFAKPTFPLLDGLGRVRTVYYEKRDQPTIHHIARDPCAAWLRAIDKPPSEHVRAWLGPAWKEEAPKVVGNPTRKKRSADDSRPRERQAYFRILWLEMEKPARNEGMWKAMQQRKGAEGCPVVGLDTHKTFTFQYSDRTTDLLTKETFQKDMSAVRDAEKS